MLCSLSNICRHVCVTSLQAHAIRAAAVRLGIPACRHSGQWKLKAGYSATTSSATTSSAPTSSAQRYGGMSFSELKEAESRKALKNLNKDQQEKLKELKLEIEDLRSKFAAVPTEMTAAKWMNLLSLETFSQRRKLLNFWFKTEMKKENDQQRRADKQLAAEQRKTTSPYVKEGGILKGTYNSANARRRVFLKRKIYANSIMFGHPLVLDMSFEDYGHRYMQNVIKQMVMCVSDNLKHPEPYRLYATDIKKNGYFDERLAIDNYNIKMELHYDSFTEHFPRKQLLYLTPHSPNIVQYNPDDIYILGAINDQQDGVASSLDKALNLKIRHGKLPLHLVSWQHGNKTLPLLHVLSILLNVQLSRDWVRAIYSSVAPRHLAGREVNIAHTAPWEQWGGLRRRD